MSCCQTRRFPPYTLPHSVAPVAGFGGSSGERGSV